MLKVEIATRSGTKDITPRCLMFPGGEVHVSLPEFETDHVQLVRIAALLKSSQDVMWLLMLTDAIRRRIGQAPIHLVMPYVPYARQDRVCNPGEAHSAKVFCDIINGQGYASVLILDPHSDVVSALLDRVLVQDASVPLSRVLTRPEFEGGVTFIAPDAGAQKRVFALAKKLGVESVVCADKVRDTKTGEIKSVVLRDDVPEGPLLVVDDICDGGRTFVELAYALPPAKCRRFVGLYVSHGIFSKGVSVLEHHYTKVFTAFDWTESDSQFVVVI